MDRLIIVTIFILPFAIPLLIIASGSTFGQRCAAAGYESKDREQCVKRLRSGGNVYLWEEGQDA